MVKPVEYYEDSSGAVHKSEQAAWKAELALFYETCEAINPASAIKLAAYSVNDIDRLQTIIQGIRGTR